MIELMNEPLDDRGYTTELMFDFKNHYPYGIVLQEFEVTSNIERWCEDATRDGWVFAPAPTTDNYEEIILPDGRKAWVLK